MGNRNKSIGDPNLRKIGDPDLRVTNPILLWLFAHGWEWPDWGTRPMNQISIALAIHDLAEKIKDKTARKQIQNIAARTVAKSAQAAVKNSL